MIGGSYSSLGLGQEVPQDWFDPVSGSVVSWDRPLFVCLSLSTSHHVSPPCKHNPIGTRWWLLLGLYLSLPTQSSPGREKVALGG